MIFPKIKESIKNSEFFRKNRIIPEEFILKYKKIKKDYIESKNEIKNKLKNDLVNFINSFLVYNIDEDYLEKYVLYLIDEFGFNDIYGIIENKNENINNAINKLNPIKLLLNNNMENIKYDKNFILEHCTPEFYIKNKNNVDKNQLKNERMIIFLNKLDDYKI